MLWVFGSWRHPKQASSEVEGDHEVLRLRLLRSQIHAAMGIL